MDEIPNADLVSREILDNVEGFDRVVDYFGVWPRFHDSEVMELHLNRDGTSWLRISVVADGFQPAQKHGIVTFHFNEILDLELRDFSRQNVIFHLAIERTERGYKLSFAPCYGLNGWLEVSALSVDVLAKSPD